MTSKAYRLVVALVARKEITGLQPKIRRQVWDAIKRLLGTVSDEQRPQDMRPLRGVPGGYRIDTGEYRVLFHLTEHEGPHCHYRESAAPEGRVPQPLA